MTTKWHQWDIKKVVNGYVLKLTGTRVEGTGNTENTVFVVKEYVFNEVNDLARQLRMTLT